MLEFLLGCIVVGGPMLWWWNDNEKRLKSLIKRQDDRIVSLDNDNKSLLMVIDWEKAQHVRLIEANEIEANRRTNFELLPRQLECKTWQTFAWKSLNESCVYLDGSDLWECMYCEATLMARGSNRLAPFGADLNIPPWRQFEHDELCVMAQVKRLLKEYDSTRENDPSKHINYAKVLVNQ